MTRCTRCHRELKRPPIVVGDYPFGPDCARQMFGRVQKPAKSVHVAGHVHRDDATPDLFSGPTNDERFALMDV
jgi:hypothetical protein